MNLKNFWEDHKPLCTVVGVIILAAPIAFLIINGIVNENERLEQLKTEYSGVCQEYNTAVGDYNREVEIINDFLAKVEQYDVIEQNETIETKPNITEDFDDFQSNGSDLTKIRNSIENLKANTENLHKGYFTICQMAYSGIVDDYNILATEYNKLIDMTSVDLIEGISQHANIKNELPYDVNETSFFEEDLLSAISGISSEIDALSADYLTAKQITNPTEEWVRSRLENVSKIVGREAVTPTNDPNGLLNKDGGYTSCVYFKVSGIDVSKIDGAGIIGKGTDAGGAIEVYSSLQDALNRCDYLAQFDDTLLYSGSYTIVGTMVIRTSYILTNNEQVDLTDEIIRAFTELKEQN